MNKKGIEDRGVVCYDNKKGFHLIRHSQLLAASSELFSVVNIITLPDEANYSFQEFLNILLHAVTSSTNSLESASNDLKSKIPNIKIPSPYTIFNYIKNNSIVNILSSFRKINDEIFRMMDLKTNSNDIAVDFHDIPYYVCRVTPSIGESNQRMELHGDIFFCTLS